MSIETLCTIIGTTVAVLGGIWVLFTFVFKVGKTREHLECFEKNTETNFKEIDKKFDTIGRRLDAIEGTIEDHTLALERLYTFMGQRFPKHANLFLRKHSPRTLTTLGEEIYKEIDGDKFLADNKELLFEFIDSEEPKTRLDVESKCFIALMALSTDDVFNSIKDYVYEKPAVTMPDGREYEITVMDVCLVLSIPLRDMYIKEKGM